GLPVPAPRRAGARARARAAGARAGDASLRAGAHGRRAPAPVRVGAGAGGTALMDVCVIAPRLPPAVDGLGDYCRRLWESWPGGTPAWSFLVADGAEASRARWPEVRIEALAPAALAGQLTALGVRTVALQY